MHAICMIHIISQNRRVFKGKRKISAYNDYRGDGMKLLRWISAEEWGWLLWYRSLSQDQRKAFRKLAQLLQQISR